MLVVHNTLLELLFYVMNKLDSAHVLSVIEDRFSVTQSCGKGLLG